MARLAVLPDGNNTPIGPTPELPDTAVTFLRDILGGANNAETVTLFWAEAVPVLRAHFLDRRRRQLMAAPSAQIEQAGIDAVLDIDTDWPA